MSAVEGADTTAAIRARLDALVIRRDYYAETHAMQVDRAVRAVLDLHVRDEATGYCRECTDEDTAFGGAPHPCSTVIAIAAALSVQRWCQKVDCGLSWRHLEGACDE